MTILNNWQNTSYTVKPKFEIKLEAPVIKHLPLKRIFDILFSTFALFITFPLFMTLAIIIRLSSPGPIIYAHKRVGRGGEPFYCFKFRSMYEDADLRLKEILKQNPSLAMEWEKNHKLKNDPRITPIGRFLRNTSFDELPQFLNILKGDLSVVGPRPVVEAELKKHFKEKASKILSIRPGLTGLWQVSGRSDISYEQRIALDEKYVENQSLMLDVTLVLKTIPAMMMRKGAY